MKMPTSDSYREYLIESLKYPEEAGGFIGAILEEKDPEPALLRNAIRKVIEAQIRMNALSESVVWGRVYIDCLRVLNIIRKTRPYKCL
jgi:hypothetical protein